jgi:hypothetical protein
LLLVATAGVYSQDPDLIGPVEPRPGDSDEAGFIGPVEPRPGDSEDPDFTGPIDTQPGDRTGVEPAGSSGSLEFMPYAFHMHLEPAVPEFARKPVLEQTYMEILTDRWSKASSGRTFEEKGMSLGDFSKIDIPVKFPKTIGRVIGQGANLSVSGSENISFGGQSRYRVNEPLTEYGQRSKFPTLDMKQHLKIDLKGTVGEKIHVMVHHDSEIETPLENRIKLRYEGDDDEIVQSVEMGNTNLTLPGSQFVSYSGKQEGLFGAKMKAKLGALDVTAVASKQEGRTSGARFEADVKDSVTIDDDKFVRNKYFFIIHPYQLNLNKNFTDIEVYRDDGNGLNNDAAIHAYAFMDPTDGSIPEPGEWGSLDYAFDGDFDVLMPNTDYAVDPLTGEISLLRPLSPTHTLAVKYIYGDASGADTVGGTVQDSLALKMIRPSDEEMKNRWEIWQGALRLERKNVYSLGRSYISEEKVEVRIYRKGPVAENIQREYEYSKILGIDLADENGLVDTTTWKTDGFADGGRVNGELGLLLFPDLRPFDPEIVVGSRPEALDSLNTNSAIYDEHYTNLRPINSLFYMVVRFTTTQTTFKLDHINILENSEVVTLNGRRLTRNTDYEIYYDIGQIRFKTEEATDPDAKIAVDYQYVPFLSMAQQSLVGVQGIYRFGGESHLGAAWLYQSKKSPEERPRLGQEPSRIMMGDVNTQLRFEPDIMTSIVNALPMVEADKPSRLTISGELGMSFPNPNTKGDVYIDDMEGVKDLRSFSMLRESWFQASPPTGLRWEDTRKIWWYVKDREVKEEDLFVEAESRPGEAFIPVLEMNYRDAMYDTVFTNPDDEWGGLMRLVSRSGSDYSELRFVEVWLRQKQGQADSMHIDLGTVNENFYRPWEPDVLHTEDKDKDGQLSVEENTGLDGIPNGAEGDDPDDNWSYSEGQYAHINGTEGDPRIVPDTEDLDGDGNLDTDDIHFRLSFDLEDTTFIVNEATKGWRQYRIPLAGADTLGGSPSWRSIKYLRFFFTGVDSQAVFQVAYLQIAGASWLEEGIRTKDDMLRADVPPEETFEISAKNTRDDPDYDPPYDPGKDPEGYRKREQSLVFSMRNLGAGHSGSVYRLIPGKASNYTLYQSLAFYAHADGAASSESLYLFVRIGSDSVNFYEYGVRADSSLQNLGSDRPGWQSIEIPLDDITNLKGSDDTVRVDLYGSPRKVLYRERPLDTGDGWIAVYGEPSITRITRIGSGVVNRRQDGVSTSSRAIEVWFNDLRLTDVRKDIGFAKRVSVAASFSDLINVNADYRHTDTEFQTLSAKRRGSDDTDYSISASTSIDRYLPDAGVSLPFSVRYHKNQSLPTLKSKSDIALKPEERKEEERSSVDDSYRLGFSRRRKSKNLLMRLTLDAVSAGATYSRKRGISPELIDRSDGYSGNISYNFSPWWKHTVRLYRGYMISYMPENVTVNVSGSTRNAKKVNRRRGVTTEDKYTRDIKGVFNVAFKPLSGGVLQTDYSLKTTRDLDLYKYVPIAQSIGWGRELTRNQRTGLRITPTFGKWMRPTMSYDVSYDENSDPKNRAQGDPAGVRRVSVSSRSKIDLFLTVGSVFVEPPKTDDTTGVSLTRVLLARIPDLNISYVLDRNSKYNKLLGRPGLKYQLGIDPVAADDLVYVSSSGGGQRTDDQTRKSGLSIGTEFEPLTTISLDSKFRYDRSDKTYAGAKTYRQTSVWPDVTGNVSSVASLSLLEGILKSSSIAIGYKGTAQIDGKGTSTKTKEVHKSEWLPLIGWDATWNNGVRTTFNVRRSNSETENLLGTRSVQETKTTVVNLSVRHSFSAPQGMYIPLAGRTLKFKSNLTLTIDLNYESSMTTTPTSRNRIDKNTRKFGIVPKASYSFSKNITGSANARFEQTSDRKLGQTWRTIGMNASVLIRF